MGAPCARIPGEGRAFSSEGGFPLTRIAHARSDLSPAGRGYVSSGCFEQYFDQPFGFVDHHVMAPVDLICAP